MMQFCKNKTTIFFASRYTGAHLSIFRVSHNAKSIENFEIFAPTHTKTFYTHKDREAYFKRANVKKSNCNLKRNSNAARTEPIFYAYAYA